MSREHFAALRTALARMEQVASAQTELFASDITSLSSALEIALSTEGVGSATFFLSRW